MNIPSLYESIYNSIQLTDRDLRKSLYKSILFCGGNSFIPGICERIHYELSKLVSSSITLSIPSKPDTKHGVWVGGSVLSSISSFDSWISKREFDEVGLSILNKKNLF
jgi:actin